MSLFRRRIGSDSPLIPSPAPADRVTSVLGPATIIKGRLSGSGGVRIEGSFEGEISLDGLLVIGENGKVTTGGITAGVVIVAGVLKGNITAEKVEIRSTGRVWGDITTGAFATQEGAFLRGQVQMEEQLELEFLDEPELLLLEEELDEEPEKIPPAADSSPGEQPETPASADKDSDHGEGDETAVESMVGEASAAASEESSAAETQKGEKKGSRRTPKKEGAA